MEAALIALATAAGTAVAQAAGKDVWTDIRDRVARLFGRGGGAPSNVVLERLDRTTAELTDAEPGEVGQVRDRVALTWQTRFLDLLEEREDADRDAVARGLQELVDIARRTGTGVSVADEGIAVGGDLHIEAHDHSAAAVRMGDVTIENPPPPGAATS